MLFYSKPFQSSFLEEYCCMVQQVMEKALLEQLLRMNLK